MMRDRRKKTPLIDYDARKRAFKKLGFAVLAISTMLGVFAIKETLVKPSTHYAAIAVNPSTPPASSSPSQPSNPQGTTSQTQRSSIRETIRKVIQQNPSILLSPPANTEDERNHYVLDGQ